MKLIVLGSNSDGNCYLLDDGKEVLMIECGVGIKAIKQALNFNTAKVTACIITHEHKDHCKSVEDLLKLGIKVAASLGTIQAMTLERHHRVTILKDTNKYLFGQFLVKPFKVQHDAKEPLGFLIQHPESGLILFLTDTYYCAYKFQGLNNIIIEANHSKEILDERMKSGESKEFLRNRVLSSHMSLDTCKEMLKANDLKAVHNIVLIHLSDRNSNEEQFRKEIFEQTGKKVFIAKAGLIIDNFNKTSF